MHQQPKHDDKAIGQHFMSLKLVTPEQLEIALIRQGQTGDRLGSILLQLGYISTERLLEVLKEHFKTPSIDLFRIHIDVSVLHIISYEQMQRSKALPILLTPKLIFMAMANPNDIHAINELEFLLGKKVQPVAAPHMQITAMLDYIGRKGEQLTGVLTGADVAGELNGVETEIGTHLIDALLTKLVERNASDLLVSAGLPPCLKLDNEVVRLPMPHLTPHDVEQMVRELVTDAQWSEFIAKGELDVGVLKPEIGRFRINCYRQRSSISLAVRSITDQLPSLASLGFSDDIERYAMQPQGLILITGPTGHGKSTTVAALVDAINARRKCNIVTIEDPIEFLHRHKKSNVNQREVGRDTQSFKEGLKHIFRQAADVIVIGEMRDADSFETAVQAAGTGHLVISTLHASTTTNAIERVIEICPAERQEQIRSQLADGLLLCICQRLIPSRDGSGRVLAYEKLASSSRIKNMIRENKSHQIRTFFQQSVEEFVPLDISLASLLKQRTISLEDALQYCENPAMLKMLIQQ